jgi:hypothetical protein
MPISILVHLMNEDAVMGEVEQLPAATDNFVTLANPRRRDGKDLPYLQANVSSVIWAIHRISFIEIIPGEAEEKLVTFVRE